AEGDAVRPPGAGGPAPARRHRDPAQAESVQAVAPSVRPNLAKVHSMIVTPAVSGYLEELRTQPDAVLAEMEEQGRREGIPIVQPETGALLHVLALAAGAQR